MQVSPQGRRDAEESLGPSSITHLGVVEFGALQAVCSVYYLDNRLVLELISEVQIIPRSDAGHRELLFALVGDSTTRFLLAPLLGNTLCDDLEGVIKGFSRPSRSM